MSRQRFPGHFLRLSPKSSGFNSARPSSSSCELDENGSCSHRSVKAPEYDGIHRVCSRILASSGTRPSNQAEAGTLSWLSGTLPPAKQSAANVRASSRSRSLIQYANSSERMNHFAVPPSLHTKAQACPVTSTNLYAVAVSDVTNSRARDSTNSNEGLRPESNLARRCVGISSSPANSFASSSCLGRSPSQVSTSVCRQTVDSSWPGRNRWPSS